MAYQLFLILINLKMVPNNFKIPGISFETETEPHHMIPNPHFPSNDDINIVISNNIIF